MNQPFIARWRLGVPLAASLVASLLLAGCNDDGGPQPVPPVVALQCSGTAIPGSGTGLPTGGPEIATGFASKDAVSTRTVMAVTANPISSRVACDILAKGGTAIDAAIAAQMALNLVEPQSSGIGGGAFMLYYDAAAKTVQSYDGRETAPAAATPNYLRYIDDATDLTLPKPNARLSGRSIGTPGVLRMLELAYQDHGRLPWRDLFQPGIDIATNGFNISPRMAASIDADKVPLSRDPDAKAYFLNADGSGKAAGTVLKNPALAATFTAIANNGASAFYTGDIGQAIIDKVKDTTGGITTGKTTLADLGAYVAKRRDPICTTYRIYYVCGMGPPSSGGI
ncbi:MAG: gamma-glutamyltransferase, partial [Burkholderiaceae bacterium]